MGKISKEKTAVRVSTKERTVYTAHDLLIKQEKGMRNIFRLFPKQGIGWKKRNMPTSTKKFLLPPKQRLTNGLVSELKI